MNIYIHSIKLREFVLYLAKRVSCHQVKIPSIELDPEAKYMEQEVFSCT